MPLPLHQLAPADLTPQMVLATFAQVGDDCTFEAAEYIADRVNLSLGNLLHAYDGWERPLAKHVLHYADALQRSLDPQAQHEHLITAALTCEAEARSAEREAATWAARSDAEADIRLPIVRERAARGWVEAAGFRHRASLIELPSVETMLRASVEAISA